MSQHPSPAIRTRSIVAAVSLGLVMTGLTGLPSTLTAQADPAETITKVVDPPSLHEFPGSTGSQSITSLGSGYIWTDKTVFDQAGLDAEAATQGDGTPVKLAFDELGVVLSARGSIIQIDRAIRVPIDLIIVLDNSRSMAQCVNTPDTYCDSPGNYTGSRAYAMMAAVNAAISIIVEDNPANRVGIAQFGTGAGVIYPLSVPHTITGSPNYVELDAPATSGGTMTFRTPTNTMTIGQVGSTVQSTNIQLGISVGMGMLAEQTPSQVSGINQHLPNVLVFTDGEPTLSSTAATWWDVPLSSGTHGPSVPGGTQYYGNGFKAALTASYLKNKITDVYNDTAFNHEMAQNPVTTNVYTVGLGIDVLTTEGKNLALATLDPTNRLGQTGNSMSAGFTSAWGSYTASPSASVTVPVAAGVSYTINHPGGADAKYDPATSKTGLKYNDDFFTPETTEELVDVFVSIAKRIASTRVNYPVETGDSPTTSGYVTFTDALGPFMGVTQMSRLAFCKVVDGPIQDLPCQSTIFENPTTQVLAPGLTRYIFTGSHPVMHSGEQADISDLVITVRQFESLARGDEVTMQIPASLLPMRGAHLSVDVDGNPLSMTVHASGPMRLFYNVAPKPGVLTALSHPAWLNQDGRTDGTALADYISSHTYGGLVRFYSNNFTVNPSGVATPGTVASWRPSATNPYYRFGFDTPLFADRGLALPLTQAAWNSLAPNDQVWYYVVEYNFADDTATAVEKTIVAQPTTKAMLLAAVTDDASVFEKAGQMLAHADMMDFARPGELAHAKCLNPGWENNAPTCFDAGMLPVLGNLTGTADINHQPIFELGNAITQLGNNGYLGFEVPGTLTIRKTLQSGNDLHPVANTGFNFTWTAADGNGDALTGSFDYAIADLADITAPVLTGQIASGQTLTLKANQQATIMGLPDGASYTVNEQTPLPPGYSLTDSQGTSGTINLTSTPALAEFENTYEPEPVSVAGPVAHKILTGRPWAASDEFIALFCPTNSSASCQSVAFSQTDAQGGQAAFAEQTFSTPGVYTYTLTEISQTQPAGVSFSGAGYLWTVTVTDNGSGQLNATTATTRQRNDDGSTVSPAAPASRAEFTNTFSADEINGQLTAHKMVFDTSIGQTRPPRAQYDFAFQYLGADLANPGAEPLVSEPKFASADANETIIVQNNESQIASDMLTFAGEHIGHTFYYKAWEIPGSITNLNYTTVNWYWQVETTLDQDGTINLVVAHCQAPNGTDTRCEPTSGNFAPVADADRVFVNEYNLGPAHVDLQGTKTLDGRGWADGEQYWFTLAANDTATRAAIIAGDISVPVTEAMTAAGSGSTPVPFSFTGLTFAKQGSYQFKVFENEQDAPRANMSYDTREIIYEVNVEDNAHNGYLDATVVVRGNADGDQVASFTNRYRAVAMFNGVDVVKTLTGRDIVAGEFGFKVSALDDPSCERAMLKSVEPLDECFLVVNNPTDGVGMASAHLTSEVNFTQHDIDQVFSYTIGEENTGRGGVTYDDTVYHVTLEPKYDADTEAMYVVATSRLSSATGQVVAIADSRDGEMLAFEFSNTYQAAPISAEPKFSKALNGRDWADDQFSFQFSAVTENAPMPTNTLVTVTSAGEAGEFSFGAIEFTSPGTYQYQVGEVVPDTPAGGIMYDLIPATITVQVTDNGEGQLVASLSSDGNHDFANYYVTVIDWEMTSTITLIGRDMVEGEFSFALTPQDQTAADLTELPLDGVTWPNSTDQPAGSAEQLTMPRGPVHFTQDDNGKTYCATINQIVPDTPELRLTYDEVSYQLCVAITDDGLGRLTATTTITGSDGSSRQFVNTSDEPGGGVPNVDFFNYYDPPKSNLTLVSIVKNPPNTSSPKGPADTTLGTTPQSPNGTTVTGNGTGKTPDGGVEKTPLEPGDYKLTTSKLKGFTPGNYTCVAQDEDGNPIDVALDGSSLNVPDGAQVTCTVIYQPGTGANTGGTVAWAQTLVPLAAALCLSVGGLLVARHLRARSVPAKRALS